MTMQTIDTGIADVIAKELVRYSDARGWLTEIYRMDEVNHLATMAYISITHPRTARGPHEHRLQTDYFIFAGPGDFRVYLYDNRPESPTHGKSYSETFGQDRPTMMIIPPRIIHAYRCVSEVDSVVINLPDRLYAGAGKKETVDEIRHEDAAESPFYSAFDRKLFMNE